MNSYILTTIEKYFYKKLFNLHSLLASSTSSSSSSTSGKRNHFCESHEYNYLCSKSQKVQQQQRFLRLVSQIICLLNSFICVLNYLASSTTSGAATISK